MKTTSAPAHKKGKTFYGWYILAVCFLTVFFALGFSYSPRSLCMAIITEDMGIPRSLYAVGESIRFITKAVVDVMFGTLIIKFGARKLLSLGFASLICATLIHAFATNVVMLYFGSFFMGMGLAWTTTTIVGHLVENWFTGNTGTIMGVILASNGLGGAVATQFIKRIISLDTVIAGWRLCYMLIALALAIVGIIVLLVVRNRPEEMGLTPLDAKIASNKKAVAELREGLPYSVIKKKPYFYVGLVGIFCTGLVLQAIYGVGSAHMKDCGVDFSIVANTLSVSSLFLMISKTSTGFIYDKFGLRFTMLVCSGCAIIAIFSLAFVSNSFMAYLYCILISFGLPLETIVLLLIAKDLFGGQSYARITGLFVAVNTFGYAVGVPLINIYYDLTGTYRPIMIVLGIVLAVIAFTMQLVITAARRDSQHI